MKSPKVTKKTIEQEIDLFEIFGVDMTDAPALKAQIGQAIIDRIVERTESGKGLRFSSSGSATEVDLKSPYSKAYQKTREFKAAGKKADEITMELTGDMVASVDIMPGAGRKIKIGITDDLQVLKAFNHITGDTVPKRPWFGISKAELKEIGQQFKSDIDSLATKDLTTDSQQALLDLLDGISDSSGRGVVTVGDFTSED
jgi:hypothetical protein